MPWADPAKNTAAKKRYAESERAKEVHRLWYAKNRERVLARVAARKKEKREIVLAKSREYSRRKYAENLEKERERSRLKSRRAYWACPELFKAREQVRRVTKRGGIGASVSPKEWREIVETFCGLCAYCLKPTEKPEREHIVPIKRGGTDVYDNVIPACARCNRWKNARGLIQWLQIGGAQ